ncbi:MAG: DUF1428 domain-containing protein [Pseudomonadota bacterium]
MTNKANADIAYVDGFTLPIAREQLDSYRRLSAAVAEVWKAAGALDYREFVLDDPTLEGTRSFNEAVAPTEDEVVVFGWVSFASREVRDRANARVAADPNMPELIESAGSGFDARRMIYGGFRAL